MPWPAVVSLCGEVRRTDWSRAGWRLAGWSGARCPETGAQPYTPVRSLGEATLWRVREQGSGRRAGFGGYTAATDLCKLIGKRDDIGVLVIARDNFFTFWPMVPGIVSSDIDARNVAQPLRRALILAGASSGGPGSGA